jgi:twitching motility protein PilT
MENIIKAAVERGASDLHIKAGDVFRARIDGKLQPLTKRRLTPEQTKSIALRLIPVEEDRKRIDSLKDYDCSWGAPGIGRFRVNILRQRSSFMVVMRVIPFEVPTFDKLNLPKVLEQVASVDYGLILISGVRGSGKSSTTAAIVNHINQHANKHIVTIESPIEFLYRDLNSSIAQREVGPDVDSFAVGLRAALRQDPDVIMIGELRDHPAADAALVAAEVGNVVVSTMNAPDAPGTLTRLMSRYPPDEQDVARMRLADALQAVVAQRLVPRADGEGRCAVVEVMLATPEIRALIRANRLGDLKAQIAEGRSQHGTQTFEQHFQDLCESGVVSPETAGDGMENRQQFGGALAEGSPATRI